MPILLGFLFILIIVGILLLFVVISFYNQLVHLRSTCINTLEEICEYCEHHGHPLHANLIETQVKTINQLGYIAQLSKQKRFYTTIARDFNERLLTFPSNGIGKIVGMKPLPLIVLTEQEQAGILPEAKKI